MDELVAYTLQSPGLTLAGEGRRAVGRGVGSWPPLWVVPGPVGTAETRPVLGQLAARWEGTGAERCSPHSAGPGGWASVRGKQRAGSHPRGAFHVARELGKFTLEKKGF